jgi:hypothetical protein
MSDVKKPEVKHEEHKEEKKPEVKHAEKCIAVRGNEKCPKCGWQRGSIEPHPVNTSGVK